MSLSYIMEVILLCIIIIYIVPIILIGIYSSRKIKNEKDFFLANRKLNIFPLTATITATTVGGSATIVAGGRIYEQGLPALWYDIAGAIGLIVLGLFLAKKVRKTKLYTLPDITGYLYDEKVRLASAILILITEITWISLLIQSSSLLLSVVLPFEYEIILITISILFIAYTLIGGQLAVVYTDIIQFFVMIIGICFIATPLLLSEALPKLSQIPLDTISFPINSNIGILTAGSIFFMMFLPHIVGPDIYSKILCAKDELSARKGVLFSGFFKFIFAISIGIISISAIVLYPNIENSYVAIPTVVFGLPTLLAGIILSAFISTMISSSDSCLISAGTILSIDILHTKNILISRIGIFIVGFFALLLSLFVTNIESVLGVSGILKTLQIAYTIFTAGLTMPVIFGFYKEKTKVTSRGALWSLILGGFTSIIWLNFAPYGEYGVLIGLAFSIPPLILFRKKTKKDNNFI